MFCPLSIHALELEWAWLSLGSKAQGKFQARTEDHSSEVPEPNFAKAVQKA